MAASSTAKGSKNRGPAPSTAKASLGHRYETLACRYYQLRGYHLLERNLRLRRGELDLIFEKHGTLVVVEVRGRGKTGGAALRPRDSLVKGKQQRLGRLAVSQARAARSKVRLELCELLGVPPKGRLRCWGAALMPGLFGVRVFRYRIDAE